MSRKRVECQKTDARKEKQQQRLVKNTDAELLERITYLQFYTGKFGDIR
jgi:hypothetical protein